MKKNGITAVITLVSVNQIYYTSDNNYINNIIKKNNIKVLKTNKLSALVKDFFLNIDFKTFKFLKTHFKSYLTKGGDICVQLDKYRKKRIIACDMDKTVIDVETIDLIANKISNNNKISELTEKAMSGGINYKNSIIERTKFLKGISLKDIEQTANNIRITKGVIEVIKTLNYHGCHTMLISGGYEIFANVVGKKIGFKEIISNKPIYKNGLLTGELKGKIIDGKEKLNCLKKRVNILNLKKFQTLAIGDGQNDIDMINYASVGIAWKAYPKVNKVADVVINYNFKSVLYFQGYSDSDIKI